MDSRSHDVLVVLGFRERHDTYIRVCTYMIGLIICTDDVDDDADED